MDNDRKRQIDDLMQTVLDCPEGERDQVLIEAGLVDKDLEIEVRSLLRSGLADDDFLQPVGALLGSVWGELITEMAAAEEQEQASSPAEDQIGPYRIDRQIGRGGMGAVYLAQRADTPDGQLVALKILSPGFDDDDVRRRFEQERHILATLDHPAIARHIDGGVTDDGRPYLTMEKVDGQPIDIHCDNHRLTIEQRLRLFLEVARAVQYAHRCMVVHRDIKPSNILVTENNHVKLLDFGIAKLLDKGDGPLPGSHAEPLTRVGLRVMTPEYASPEQVRGGLVTTATDVYQLGVLLYELLSGQRPYRVDGRTPAEIERVICEHEPVALSTSVRHGDGESTQTGSPSFKVASSNRRLSPGRLQARLRGDLNIITLKALRKEPERRYLSVDHLIEDIERHLEGHAISARKDTVSYRVSKFVQRHRIGLGAGIVIFGLIAMMIGFYVDRQIAEHEQTRREAERASQVVTFLEGLFDVAEPGRGSGEAISAKELLDHGVEQITSDLELQPLLQATLQELLGDMYRKLGIYEQARPLLEQALETRRKFQGDHHPDVSASLNTSGRLYLEIGMYNAAVSLLREALSIQQTLSAGESLLAARIQANLAEVLVATGEPEEAELLFQHALQIFKSELGPNHQEIAKTLIGLSSLFWSEQRLEDAEPLLLQALEILQEAGDCNNRLCAIALSDLGQLHAQRGEYEQAEQLLQRGYSVLEGLLGSRHPDTAIGLKAIARLKAEQGLLDEAEPLFQQALGFLQEVHQGQHPDIAECLHDIALLHWDRGEYDKAEQLLRQALVMGEATLGADHPDVGAGLNSLGALYWRLGRLADAEAAYRRSLAIVEQALGRDHPHLAVVLVNLAGVLGEQGDYEMATKLCERAVSVNDRGLGSQPIDAAYSRAALANLYAACGGFEQAETLLQRVLQAKEQLFGAEHPELVSTLQSLCKVSRDQGFHDEAIDYCERSINIGEHTLGPNDPEVADGKIALAEVLLLNNSSLQRAEILLRQASSIMIEAFGAESLELVPLRCLLAQVLVKRDRSTEADQVLRRAIELTVPERDRLIPEQLFDLAETYLVLGELQQSSGQHNEAKRIWNAALKLTEPYQENGCNVRWSRIHAVTLLHLDRIDEGQGLAETLLAKGYRHPQIIF